MRSLQSLATSLAIVWVLLLLAEVAEAGDLKVTRPWVSLPLMEDEPAQVYFSLENNGKTDRKLVAASSPRAERVEIHTTEFVDGAETTVALKEWDVPGGSVVLFTEGGVVLMLIGTKDLKEGEKIEIEIEFRNGEKLRMAALVRDA